MRVKSRRLAVKSLNSCKDRNRRHTDENILQIYTLQTVSPWKFLFFFFNSVNLTLLRRDLDTVNAQKWQQKRIFFVWFFYQGSRTRSAVNLGQTTNFLLVSCSLVKRGKFTENALNIRRNLMRNIRNIGGNRISFSRAWQGKGVITEDNNQMLPHCNCFKMKKEGAQKKQSL